MRLLPLICLLVGIACEDEGAPLGRPHVVLVVADTLRADHVGPWGAPGHATPFLDELAARSVVFDDATSASSQTVPSVLSIWSGLYPKRHGNRYFPQTRSFRVDRPKVWPQLDDSIPLLHEQLRAAGYATGAIVTNPWLQRRYGFDRGFDVYRILSRGGVIVRGGEVNEVLATLLPSPDRRPLFLYLHYMDPHPPFDPAPEFREPFMSGLSGRALDAINSSAAGIPDADVAFTRGLYSASIREFDERLRELFTTLEAKGFADDLLFVLMGDHGEEFAEHGGIGHGFALYQESVRVPLLISHRSLTPRRVRVPVSAVDVLPTLLDLLDLPPVASLDGVSLAAATRGRDETGLRERPVFAELGHRVAARVGSWKAIADRRDGAGTEVFDLSADPGESNSVGEGERPPEAVAEALAAFDRLEPAVDGETEPEPLDPRTQQQLRGLGYLRATDE